MQLIKDFFNLLNDVLLKMTWLDALVKWFFGDVIGISEESLAYSSLTFFVYDVIKIFILLGVLIFISSYIQSYFSPEKTRRLLKGKSGIGANTLGALLGTVTPFCSCSSIPIFIGFTKAGLPVGVTFSFLISSPLVDLASILLLASIFNWKIALAYVIVGLIIAIIGGSIISFFKMDDQVADFIKEERKKQSSQDLNEYVMTKKERIQYAFEQVKEIFNRVWIYILIGVGIGAFIHGFIPQEFVLTVLGDNNPFSVLIATLVGVPMYADIFGTLPIAEALILKGVGIGTVLAFMMAVTALSLPSLIMIKKVIKPRLFFLFTGIVITGIIIMGYVFNLISYLFI
ncbi:MAG TPA: permease [Acholeplasmataceae bacterium]|nr:permease [Acholeplasmataceae bacterium]HRX44869.1 permease [Acholeplasmataceae bacterium]